MLFIPLALTSKRFHEFSLPEFFAMFLFMIAGFQFMVATDNLILIFVGLETASLSLYTLIALHNRDKSFEAAIKYFTMGALAAGFYTMGAMILYALSGSVEINEIAKVLAQRGYEPLWGVLAAVVFMIASIGFKLSMVPFHTWTPDVYEGAPTPITAFLSVAPKAAGFAILIRVFYTMFTIDGSVTATLPLTNINWPALIAVASAITMTLGNLLAVQQDDVKRLLAYSTISHVGFILMAFAIISPEAVRAIMLYLFIYLFMNLAAFYMAIFASNKLNAHHIEDWDGLSRKNPVLCAFMALTLISLTGLPPTAGFVGKFYIFAELFKHQQFYWLAVVAILNSVVSLFYYFKIVKSMYLADPDAADNKIDAHPVVNWSIILFSSQNLLFFLYWEPLIGFIEKSINLWKG